MKRIYQWLESLPVEYRGKAFLNTPPQKLDEECNSLSEAIRRSFSWNSSSEGNNYWAEVYCKFASQ